MKRSGVCFLIAANFLLLVAMLAILSGNLMEDPPVEVTRREAVRCIQCLLAGSCLTLIIVGSEFIRQELDQEESEEDNG